MFASLLRLLSEPEARKVPDLRLSVAVLLLEAARQDDNFDVAERAVIEKLLTSRFGLSHDDCVSLIEKAQARSAQMVQIHGHTSEIADGMTPDERIQLIEMLWEVAYADGVLDPEEDLLIRRVAGLIYVSDRDRVMARQRALAKRAAQAGQI
jgi:uncharacterized tellurite resistance protein B-like protein